MLAVDSEGKWVNAYADASNCRYKEITLVESSVIWSENRPVAAEIEAQQNQVEVAAKIAENVE